MKTAYKNILSILSIIFILVGSTAPAYADFSKEELDAYTKSINYQGLSPDNIPPDVLEGCKKIYNAYKARGLSNTSAMAGVANNAEESKCTADAVEVGGGGGFGAFQYTGPSLTQYKLWASANNKDYTKLDSQIQYWFEGYYQGYEFSNGTFRSNTKNNYCPHADKFIDCSKIDSYFVEDIDGWYKINDVYVATLFFQSFLERSNWTMRHSTENRQIFANYFKDIIPVGGVGDTTGTADSSSKKASDETLNLSGSEPLEAKDLTGYVEEGKVEGGKEIEIKTRADLTEEESNVLATNQEYQKFKQVGFLQFVHIGITFAGLVIILYGLAFLAITILDYNNNLIKVQLLPAMTFGKYRLAYDEDSVSKENGTYMLGSLLGRSFVVMVIGIIVCTGVATGVVASILDALV